MVNKPCPFCEFDKSTEFYYFDKWRNIIVCRDLRNLGFKYRLLAVRVGIGNHKSLPTVEEREDLLVPLVAVAVAQIANGKAKGYDIDEIVKSEHYHFHANLN